MLLREKGFLYTPRVTDIPCVTTASGSKAVAPHCLQDSDGALFHPDLMLPHNIIKITKGVRFDKDQNSVFDETDLEERLKRDME